MESEEFGKYKKLIMHQESREHGKMETTTIDSNENYASTFALNCDQISDSNHENLSYFNSGVTDNDSDYDIISIFDDFEYDNKTIEEEDSEDSENTIREEFSIDERRKNFSDNLPELLSEKYAGNDLTYEKIGRIQIGRGKESIDSAVSINIANNDNIKIIRRIIDSRINSQEIIEENDIIEYNNIEDNMGDKKLQTEMGQINDTSFMNYAADPFQGELDVRNRATSRTADNTFYPINSESDVENDIDFLSYKLKYANEDVKSILSDIATNHEQVNTEDTSTKIKNVDRIIDNFLCTNDDGPFDSSGEYTAGISLAKVKNDDDDDITSKIIKSCPNAFMDYLQYYKLHEGSNADLKRSNSQYTIKKWQENELFPCRRVLSETDIAKEDILKTIEEAEKILTNDTYWETSTVHNKLNENCGAGDSVEKPTKNIQEHQMESNCIKNDDTIANVEFERINVSNSDDVESNFKKLAEITCSDYPKSYVEVHETIDKITKEKQKIEERKKESLEILSKKFDQIEQLIVEQSDVPPNNDSCRISNTSDSDSLDEFQINPTDFESPLTKSEITENLKIEEFEKVLTDEMEKRKKLINDNREISAVDLESTKLLEIEQTRQISDVQDIDEIITQNAYRDNEKTSDESTNEIMNGMIEPETDDSFADELLKEPERTYIKGKMYDFDEKVHRIR